MQITEMTEYQLFNNYHRLKRTILRLIMPRRLVKVDRCFGEKHYLNFQSRIVSHAIKHQPLSLFLLECVNYYLILKMEVVLSS
jgi:hypothetical protein